VLVTSFAFGPGIWPVWVSHVVDYSRQFAIESGDIAHLMPTVSAALAQLRAPRALTEVAQFSSTVAAAAIVWLCFRRGPTPLAAAALFVATFLASPHAFVYDMPPVTTAVLWVIAERHHAGEAFGTGEILVLMLAMILPIALVAGPTELPVMPLSLAMLLGLIAHRCLRRHSTIAFGPSWREV